MSLCQLPFPKTCPLRWFPKGMSPLRIDVHITYVHLHPHSPPLRAKITRKIHGIHSLKGKKEKKLDTIYWKMNREIKSGYNALLPFSLLMEWQTLDWPFRLKIWLEGIIHNTVMYKVLGILRGRAAMPHREDSESPAVSAFYFGGVSMPWNRKEDFHHSLIVFLS